MFPFRYFVDRFFPTRYFPKIGHALVLTGDEPIVDGVVRVATSFDAVVRVDTIVEGVVRLE